MNEPFELRLVLSVPVPSIDDTPPRLSDLGEVEVFGRPERGLSTSEIRDLRQQIRAEYEGPFARMEAYATIHGGVFKTHYDEPRQVRQDVVLSRQGKIGADRHYFDGGSDVPAVITGLLTVMGTAAARSLLRDAKEIIGWRLVHVVQCQSLQVARYNETALSTPP